MDEAELPRALIKRIAKAGLSHQPSADGKDIQLSKDALLALSESARVFINYLTATGNDICKDAKRQIISIEDVYTALEDLEFQELLPPLKESLEVFKAETKEKSKKRSEQQKRRKLEGAEHAAAAAAAAAAATAQGTDGAVAGVAAPVSFAPLAVQGPEAMAGAVPMEMEQHVAPQAQSGPGPAAGTGPVG